MFTLELILRALREKRPEQVSYIVHECSRMFDNDLFNDDLEKLGGWVSH